MRHDLVLQSNRAARLYDSPGNADFAKVGHVFSLWGRLMGSLSIWHWLLVIGVGVLLFGGKGKISSVMGDFAKGIKAFKAGMKEPEEEAVVPPAQVPPPASVGATAAGPSTAAAGVAERPHEHA